VHENKIAGGISERCKLQYAFMELTLRRICFPLAFARLFFSFSYRYYDYIPTLMKPTHIFLFVVLSVAMSCSEEKVVAPNESNTLADEKTGATARDGELIISIRAERISLSVELFGEGIITVDWGDGTSETIIPQGSEASFSFLRDHTYTKSKPHRISLTGTIEKIVSIGPGLPEGISVAKAVTFSGLENVPVLWNLTTDSAIPFGRIDLSSNFYIRAILLENSSVQSLILPTEHNLKYVALNGEGSNYDFDAIVESIFHNAVAENIFQGYLGFENYGLLTAQSLQYLEVLRSEYEWNIVLK
jgi:hypothetical protein